MQMNAVAFTFKTADGNPRLIRAPTPTAGPTDVIVRVEYSALDRTPQEVLQKTMTGYFVHDLKADPLLLGWHFSGSVVDTGDQVQDRKIGDKVFGFLHYEPKQKQGSLAEYIRVGEDECALVSPDIDMKLAAASTTEAVTALQAMRDLGGIKDRSTTESLLSQQKVLVLGAGGGVGSAAVGIAKKMGAHVTAVCGTKDIKRVKGFGADEVMDRSQHKSIFGTLKSNHQMFDIVFDTPAKYSAMGSFGLLRKRGAYVTTIPTLGMLAGMFVSMFNGKSVKFVECHSRRSDLELLAQWLQEGLQVDIDSTYSVKDMEDAMKRQASRAKVGRVVIKVDHQW